MRLIDADSLIEYLLEKLSMYDSVGAKMGLVPLTIRNDLQGFVETINEQPTIDAVPVRHGEWIEADLDKDFRRCSVCKNKKSNKTAWSKDFVKMFFNYCPNCGAFMDRKEKK